VKIFKLIAALIVGVCALQIYAAQPASAETFTWKFRSEHKSVVDVELYSKTRRHIWPGNGKVYTIKDYSNHSVDIACQPGEKICYGAWVRNSLSKQWGLGKGGRGGCDHCCYTCTGGTTPILVLK
jgi:hypothetical protein